MSAQDMRRWCVTAALLGAWLAVGCKSAVLGGGSSRNDDAATPQAKPATDQGKPTDEGESLPGYLVDPAVVGLTVDSARGEATISAAAGAIARDGGSPAGLLVRIWTSTLAAAAAAAPDAQGARQVRAELRATLRADDTGTLQTTVSTGGAELLWVTVGPQPRTDGLVIRDTAETKTATGFAELGKQAQLSAVARLFGLHEKTLDVATSLAQGGCVDQATNSMSCLAAADGACSALGFGGAAAISFPTAESAAALCVGRLSLRRLEVPYPELCTLANTSSVFCSDGIARACAHAALPFTPGVLRADAAGMTTFCLEASPDVLRLEPEFPALSQVRPGGERCVDGAAIDDVGVCSDAVQSLCREQGYPFGLRLAAFDAATKGTVLFCARSSR